MDNRPAVTVFYDVPDWAFHNIAYSIARVGAATHGFRTLGRDDWFGNPRVALDAMMASDIVVFLWRFDLLALLDTLDAEACARIASRGPAIVTIVYDHLYQSAEDLAHFGNPFELSDVVAACSDRLRDQYAGQPHLPDIGHVVPDGVDLTRFAPMGRESDAACKLRIGWVGNSAWGSTVGTDLKGKHSVFEPALAMLRGAGLAFETRVADRAVGRAPLSGMPDLYRDIDVLVCTSAIEGTPNPVLEAMASGAAIVSTDVGIVRQVLGPAQSEFVLKHRSAKAVAEALARLIRDPWLVSRLQAENLARRETLAWASRWPLWAGLFAEAIETASAEAPGQRAERFLRFQARKRSRLERLRGKVAGSRRIYRTYETMREHCPGAIRLAKRILQRGQA